MAPAIPMLKSRKPRVAVDRGLRRLRNLVGRRFNRLGNTQRVATRCDKIAGSSLVALDTASIRLRTCQHDLERSMQFSRAHLTTSIALKSGQG